MPSRTGCHTGASRPGSAAGESLELGQQIGGGETRTCLGRSAVLVHEVERRLQQHAEAFPDRPVDIHDVGHSAGAGPLEELFHRRQVVGAPGDSEKLDPIGQLRQRRGHLVLALDEACGAPGRPEPEHHIVVFERLAIDGLPSEGLGGEIERARFRFARRRGGRRGGRVADRRCGCSTCGEDDGEGGCPVPEGVPDIPFLPRGDDVRWSPWFRGRGPRDLVGRGPARPIDTDALPL
jgi:hypothetical protein